MILIAPSIATSVKCPKDLLIGTDLSETHLVGENAIDTLLVERGQPIETLELVFLEGSHEHLRLSDRQLARERCRVLEV